MSSLSSNNSNADMEVINAEDLEDSPPPGEAEDVTAVDEMKDSQETKEEEVVVEATASGDTEQIGEIVGVDEEIVNESASEEVAAVEEDDDPPIEILDAPTPPLAEDSVPGTAVEVVPAVEVAPIVAAAVPTDPTPAAAIVETPAPTLAAAVVKEDDDDPPIEILEAPTAPLAQKSFLEPEVEVAPAAVEVASVEAAAPTAAAAEPTPAVATLETPAPAPAAAPAPQPQVVSVRPTVTAERPAATLEEVDDEEEDDDIDETLAERLVGLTEMFPDFVRTGSVSLVKSSWSLTQSCYSLGRAASWVIFSSATLLFMPIMIESERLQMQDQMKAQKNQILLGPGAAVSGGPSLGPPPI